MSQYVKVGTPALKALTCLESNEATAADVFIFWHAILAEIKAIITSPDAEYPVEVQEQIIGILNSRHQQVFGDGNLSARADVYLSATYLDPRKFANFLLLLIRLETFLVTGFLKSDLFKASSNDSAPSTQTTVDFTGIRSVLTFKRVVKCVIGLGHKEIYHGKNPELTKWKGHAQNFNKACLRELMKYARGMYPYSERLSETGLAINWWRDIQSMQQEDATILPVSILFFYSTILES